MRKLLRSWCTLSFWMTNIWFHCNSYHFRRFCFCPFQHSRNATGRRRTNWLHELHQNLMELSLLVIVRRNTRRFGKYGFTQRFFIYLLLISISFSIAFFFFYQISKWFRMIYHRKTQLRYIGPKCKAWQIDMVSLIVLLQSSFWSFYFHFSSITVLILGKFYFDSKLYFLLFLCL